MLSLNEYSKNDNQLGVLHIQKGAQRPSGSTIALSIAPFVLSFAIVYTIAWKTLFPLLSGHLSGVSLDPIVWLRNPRFWISRIPHILATAARASVEFAPAGAFSTTIALTAVLAELLLCEILNILNPYARSIALQATISALLVCLIIVVPTLEIHSITSAANWKASGLQRNARAFAWLLDVTGLVIWLTLFWWMGRAVLGTHAFDKSAKRHWKQQDFSKGSLERIGIIGISSMASLAGFAAVSTLWHTFGLRTRPIGESDIARKRAGLEATTDLLLAKESRLRALEHKLNECRSPTSGNFASRMFNSVYGGSDTSEMASLRMEIEGLETMQQSLSTSLRLLQSQRDAQQQAGTTAGRVFLVLSYLFSIYCLYRIAASSLATVRRWFGPAKKPAFSSSDPINNLLSIVAKHWDPSIDRATWSRIISFLLSGLMLLVSFNAVLQTFLLLSRFTPQRLLHSAQQNLALLVAQITGTYVVSSALLLRSNLPLEIGSVIESALGAPLDSKFIDQWFEGWFLGACIVTAAGIVIGRKVMGKGDWEDELDPTNDPDVELGKQS
ncbi:MAG: hypothetical protein Q9159_006484 [Coniocarpon cinnabarinum]